MQVAIPSITQRYTPYTDYVSAQARNTIPRSFQLSSRKSVMPSSKLPRTSSYRKADLLSNFGYLSEAIRPCKRCISRNLTYLLSKSSEKYIGCVSSGKSCDLIIPPSKLRRVYKERIRVRNKVRKVKAKLYRIETRLRDLENEEEGLVNSKQSTIQSLEDNKARKTEEKSKEPENPDFPFDVLAENFYLPDTDWSPFAFGFLNLSVPAGPVGKNVGVFSCSL